MSLSSSDLSRFSVRDRGNLGDTFHLWLIDGEEFVSEHAGAFSGDALEEPCEVLRVLEAEVVCNDADVIVGGSESPLGFGNQFERDDFLRGVSGFPFDKVSEIARCEVRFFCEI